MKIVVAFSGGKDSQASLIWAVKEMGVPAEKLEAVFCDTGWENKITYDHVVNVCEQMGVKMVTAKSSVDENGMVDLVKRKKRFPARKARFCTEELKTKPMVDYILAQKESLIIIQGIRNDESFDRLTASRECTFFKYYFQPYQTNSMIVERIEGYAAKRLLSVKEADQLTKAKERLAKGKEDAKYFTYRKKEVIEWRKNYADDILRPVISWTAVEVLNYILENGQKPNMLYYLGFSRVGCFPCVLCNHGEIKLIRKHFPERIQEIIALEKEVGSTFFRPDYLKKGVGKQRSHKGDRIITMQDVENYFAELDRQGVIFEEPEPDEDSRCMSHYKICE